MEFHDKEMKISDLKKFIPNYSSLSWRKIEIDSEFLGTCEITAVDGEFKINVARQAGDITSDKMLQEFGEFMKE